MRTGTGMVMAAVIAAASVGCAEKPPAAAVTIENRVYELTSDQVTVTPGIVVGEVMELKVTERVEPRTGRAESPAKLTGKLKLTNSATDQVVRLIDARILYADDQGQLIAIGELGINPTPGFLASSHFPGRLDPRQEVTQSVDMELPAEAMGIRQFNDLRIHLTYFSVMTGTRSASR